MFILQGIDKLTSQHNSTNKCLDPTVSEVSWTHTSSLLNSTISKVMIILEWWTITTLNRKLLEKQRVWNSFAFYEVHTGHVSQCHCYHRLYKSVKPVKYYITGLTNWQADKLTDGQNWLLKPLCACTCKVKIHPPPPPPYRCLQQFSMPLLFMGAWKQTSLAGSCLHIYSSTSTGLFTVCINSRSWHNLQVG